MLNLEAVLVFHMLLDLELYLNFIKIPKNIHIQVKILNSLFIDSQAKVKIFSGFFLNVRKAVDPNKFSILNCELQTVYDFS
jgi:hypothetical protein